MLQLSTFQRRRPAIRVLSQLQLDHSTISQGLLSQQARRKLAVSHLLGKIGNKVASFEALVHSSPLMLSGQCHVSVLEAEDDEERGGLELGAHSGCTYMRAHDESRSCWETTDDMKLSGAAK